jgi:hypothetical protein
MEGLLISLAHKLINNLTKIFNKFLIALKVITIKKINKNNKRKQKQAKHKDRYLEFEIIN